MGFPNLEAECAPGRRVVEGLAREMEAESMRMALYHRGRVSFTHSLSRVHVRPRTPPDVRNTFIGIRGPMCCNISFNFFFFCFFFFDVIQFSLPLTFVRKKDEKFVPEGVEVKSDSRT